MKINIRTMGLVVTGLILLLICGAWCWWLFSAPSSADNWRRPWIYSSEATNDCEAAIARGDFRFWAVNGFASGMVLGTDQYGDDQDLIETHGFKIVSETSDDGEGFYNSAASKYVRAYNGVLLKHLRLSTNSHN